MRPIRSTDARVPGTRTPDRPQEPTRADGPPVPLHVRQNAPGGLGSPRPRRVVGAVSPRTLGRSD
ncbi:hypothetical protein SK069_16850 [Patulibacter brassicae]|uniref:Uncharacterized protein n=1 Tax=Patulibacter brassicae TaxID=1705717 RepID=A0ABU4VPA4_9ACTN|nr:hypothetical protein [Patulibacter brassicae]MDX8153270.1 hypothetical protein [Patulibacter brassicae]